MPLEDKSVSYEKSTYKHIPAGSATAYFDSSLVAMLHMMVENRPANSKLPSAAGISSLLAFETKHFVACAPQSDIILLLNTLVLGTKRAE